MKDIIFYDFDFNRIADFSKFTSLNFEKNYCGFGTAEIHYSLADSEVITLLEENSNIFFVAGEHSAIVTGWRLDEDIAIFARTPEWLLSKRGAKAFSKENMTAEEIARELVENAAGDFVNLGTLAGVGEKMNYSTDDMKPLHNVVAEVLSTQKLGFRVLPDIPSKSFVFEVFEGKESSRMLSVSNRTAHNMSYDVDRQDEVSGSGWYKRRFVDKGNWDAQGNSPVLSDNQIQNAYTFYRITSDSYDLGGDIVNRFGLWCRKDTYLYSDSPDGKWKISESRPDTIWIYLGQPDKTGAERWDAVLTGVLTEDEAKAEIAKRIQKETSETETNNMVYGEDYDLGDIVKVQLEFGEFKKTEEKRVSAVNIYYDTNCKGVIPILGKVEE